MLQSLDRRGGCGLRMCLVTGRESVDPIDDGLATLRGIIAGDPLPDGTANRKPTGGLATGTFSALGSVGIVTSLSLVSSSTGRTKTLGIC